MSESLLPIVEEVGEFIKMSFTAVPPSVPPGAAPPQGAMPPDAGMMPPGAVPQEAPPQAPPAAAPPSSVDPELVNLLTMISARMDKVEQKVEHAEELRKAREDKIMSQTTLAE